MLTHPCDHLIPLTASFAPVTSRGQKALGMQEDASSAPILHIPNCCYFSSPTPAPHNHTAGRQLCAEPHSPCSPATARDMKTKLSGEVELQRRAATLEGEAGQGRRCQAMAERSLSWRQRLPLTCLLKQHAPGHSAMSEGHVAASALLHQGMDHGLWWITACGGSRPAGARFWGQL